MSWDDRDSVFAKWLSSGVSTCTETAGQNSAQPTTTSQANTSKTSSSTKPSPTPQESPQPVLRPFLAPLEPVHYGPSCRRGGLDERSATTARSRYPTLQAGRYFETSARGAGRGNWYKDEDETYRDGSASTTSSEPTVRTESITEPELQEDPEQSPKAQ